MKKYFLLLILLMCFGMAMAQDEELTLEEQELFAQMQTDSIKGETEIVQLEGANSSLVVPDGFVFLNPTDSRHLLVDYWGNSEDRVKDILGTLVKVDAGIFYNVETAYVVSYSDIGYVSDKDAAEIDYDELLKSMQNDIKEENGKNSSGQKWELVGWAWHPTYDANKKVLGWAKHYRVDGNDVINYDVRILGRFGAVTITAVAGPDAKDELMANNDAITSCIVYDEGSTYADFNPDRDHVAEWTIGGLVAGKILTKVGFWAVIAKFWKIIIVAIVAFFATIRKKIGKWLGFKSDDSYVEAE